MAVSPNNSKEASFSEVEDYVTKDNVEVGDVLETRKAEKRVVLKQDLIILPLLSLSYFFAYLDRGQIGNARVLGMQTDLGLSGQQYYNVVMMFYVGYMLIELPAGMALRYIHPRYVFSGALIVFGVCASCLAISRHYETALVLRVLIGLGEAFMNDAWLFISVWYRPDELALRSAAVYGTTPIAGAVSGLMAYAIGKNMEGASGMRAWQWLFIIEGVITVGFAFVVLFMMPGMPDFVARKGSWLFSRPNEREIISRRYQEGQNSKDAKFRIHQVWMALKDPKLYLGAIMVGAQGIGIGAFTVFLPTFIQAFGFSVLDTQLFSMIPYGCALVLLIFFAYACDRWISKSYVTVICLSITSVGLIILLCVTDRVALMIGACLVAGGAYPGLISSVSFNLVMHGGYTKRTTAVWITQVFIQAFSMIASQVYRTPPRFYLGHGFALGIYVVAIGCTLLLRMILSRANAAKTARKEDYERRGEVDADAEKSFEDLGDFHPRYFYSL